MASITKYTNRFAIFTEDIDVEKSPFGIKQDEEPNVINNVETINSDTNNNYKYNPFKKQTNKINSSQEKSDEYTPFNRKKHNDHRDFNEHNPFHKKTYDKHQNNSEEQNPFGRKQNKNNIPYYQPIVKEVPKNPTVPSKEEFPSLQKNTKKVSNVTIATTTQLIKDKSFAGIMQEWKEKDDNEKQRIFEAQQEHERQLEEQTKRINRDRIHIGTFICPKHVVVTSKKKTFIKRIVYDKDGKFIGEYDYKFPDVKVEEDETYEDFYDEEITELDEEQEYLKSRVGEDAFSDNDFEEINWEDEMEQHQQELEEDTNTDEEEYNQEIEDQFYYSKRG